MKDGLAREGGRLVVTAPCARSSGGVGIEFQREGSSHTPCTVTGHRAPPGTPRDFTGPGLSVPPVFSIRVPGAGFACLL